MIKPAIDNLIPNGENEARSYWCIFPDENSPADIKVIPYPSDEVLVEDFDVLICMNNL